VETDISLLYGGQQKNVGIRGMRMVEQIEESDVQENTLVIIMILRWSKNRNRGRERG
jgi:phosphoserine aminotransferase